MSEYSVTIDKLEESYQATLKEWKYGKLGYAFIDYLRQYGRDAWWKRNLKYLKRVICACLALQIHGLPVNSQLVSYLSDSTRPEAYEALKYLASYGVLKPIAPIKRVDRGGYVLRAFSITEAFLQSVTK